MGGFYFFVGIVQVKQQQGNNFRKSFYFLSSTHGNHQKKIPSNNISDVVKILGYTEGVLLLKISPFFSHHLNIGNLFFHSNVFSNSQYYWQYSCWLIIAALSSGASDEKKKKEKKKISPFPHFACAPWRLKMLKKRGVWGGTTKVPHLWLQY